MTDALEQFKAWEGEELGPELDRSDTRTAPATLLHEQYRFECPACGTVAYQPTRKQMLCRGGVLAHEPRMIAGWPEPVLEVGDLGSGGEDGSIYRPDADERDRYEHLCMNCGLTWGAHRNTDSRCPGHEGRMDWDAGPGTSFAASDLYDRVSRGTAARSLPEAGS